MIGSLGFADSCSCCHLWKRRRRRWERTCCRRLWFASSHDDRWYHWSLDHFQSHYGGCSSTWYWSCEVRIFLAMWIGLPMFASSRTDQPIYPSVQKHYYSRNSIHHGQARYDYRSTSRHVAWWHYDQQGMFVSQEHTNTPPRIIDSPWPLL